MSERRCEGCAVPISKDDTDFCVVCDHVRAAHLVQIEDLKKQAKSLRSDNERLKRERKTFAEALGPDLAGRDFAELLDEAAYHLLNVGGGPIVDCLRAKAEQARAALALVGEE